MFLASLDFVQTSLQLIVRVGELRFDSPAHVGILTRSSGSCLGNRMVLAHLKLKVVVFATVRLQLWEDRFDQ